MIPATQPVTAIPVSISNIAPGCQVQFTVSLNGNAVASTTATTSKHGNANTSIPGQQTPGAYTVTAHGVPSASNPDCASGDVSTIVVVSSNGANSGNTGSPAPNPVTTTASQDTGILGSITGALTGAVDYLGQNPRVRNLIYGRRESDKDILRSAATLRRVGVNYAVDIILDNPLETAEDRRLTLDLLLRLPRPFTLVTHTLAHFPGTALTRAMLDQGMIRREEVEDIKGSSFIHWANLMDLHRDNENLFWDCLYYMASRRSFPAGLIRWLSCRSFLRRHPRPLARLLRLTTASAHTIEQTSRLSRLRARAIGRLLKIYRGLWTLSQRYYWQWTGR